MLEQNPHDADLINRIFRAAHTLKGFVGSMGFDKIATLAHDMENVLDRIRHQELSVTREIIKPLV
jgi:two-component system chemotaxis sensor kinase CheA